MRKGELVTKIAKKTLISELNIETVLNSFLSEVKDSLKKGKRVTLTGFGTFLVRKRKKRTQHDIASGGIITVPAHKLVGFVPGLPLKRLVK